MMHIPHSKPYINDRCNKEVLECISGGNIAHGQRSEIFRNELAAYTGAQELYLASSGSSALLIALKALNIGEGDEVILPTYVCRSVADVVIALKAKPVFCDIEENWLMSVKTVTPLISNKTSAIIIVHIFGLYADVESFRQLNIPLIEDCCQLFGHTDMIRTGIYSDFSFYSFHATKCLTTGEGGAVACFNNEYLDAMNFAYASTSILYPLSDISSALGGAQLMEYKTMLTRRQRIALHYFEVLPQQFTNALINAGQSIYFRFPLRTEKEFEEVKTLAYERGVSVRNGVDALLHKTFNVQGEFPVAEHIYNETVSIPIYPALSDQEVEKVCTVIKAVLE